MLVKQGAKLSMVFDAELIIPQKIDIKSQHQQPISFQDASDLGQKDVKMGHVFDDADTIHGIEFTVLERQSEPIRDPMINHARPGGNNLCYTWQIPFQNAIYVRAGHMATQTRDRKREKGNAATDVGYARQSCLGSLLSPFSQMIIDVRVFPNPAPRMKRIAIPLIIRAAKVLFSCQKAFLFLFEESEQFFPFIRLQS